RVNLLTQAGHLHVDHVVERRGPARLLPDLARQHLPRYEVALMTEQVFQELEFPRSQVEQPVASRRATGDEVHFQIGRLQPEYFRRTTAPQQGADAGEQLGQRKRLDQVVVGAQVQP